MKRHAAPIIAAVLLLLLLYVGSYLAMVVPAGNARTRTHALPSGKTLYESVISHYRLADDAAARFYWPLEQIDRQVRPEAWEQPMLLGPQFRSIYDPAIHN